MKRVGYIILLTALTTPVIAQKRLQVVSTLPDYASIAASVGGERVAVQSIATGYQDAHFVKAKPSFARMLSEADLLLNTGMDLELWAPTLIDKSRNPRIREGAPGYVSVSRGISFLEVPVNPSRSAGDIHVYGNPHIHTDPLRGVQIAENIAAGLVRIDPSHRIEYEENLQNFKRQLFEKLYGEELVQLVGGEQLSRLTWAGQLDDFLSENTFQDRPLSEFLAGWFRQARCLKGVKIVAYHRNWIYFTERFGIRIADYVEDKPGIPPSARHVIDLVEKIKALGIQALITANYYDESAPRAIAEKTGARAVVVPPSVGGTPEAATYFNLIDIWIRELRKAVPACSKTVKTHSDR